VEVWKNDQHKKTTLMKIARKFAISPRWKILLNDMGIDPTSALTFAGLPTDLLNREDTSLSASEYFRLWRGIEQASDKRDIGLLLAKNISAEAFDAPIFACLCSPNFNSAIKRLKHYKPLIGPMVLHIDVNSKTTTLRVECYGSEEKLPRSLSISEMVFFTQLIRLATREPIAPQKVCVPELPENLEPYIDYFGCKVVVGSYPEISFRKVDSERPFLTANAPMWEFFEGQLDKRLAQLQSDATTTDRVRAVLLEALPSGESSVEFVADNLAMSKRTLQRKLTSEAESFQSILLSVRSELADHYLEKSKLSLAEISFLLGYEESNSFIRAYRSWRGVSPGHYREQLL
jgi:AraC-like DNA-binding protein